MADKKPDAVVEKAPVETFDADEIAQNADHLFGYSRDLTAAALEMAGVKRCTLEEAKQITKNFAERKVK